MSGGWDEAEPFSRVYWSHESCRPVSQKDLAWSYHSWEEDDAYARTGGSVDSTIEVVRRNGELEQRRGGWNGINWA